MKRTILFKEVDGFKVVQGFSHKILNNVGGRKKLAGNVSVTDESKAVEVFKAANFPFAKNIKRNERRNLLNQYKELLDILKTKTATLAKDAVTFFPLKPGELDVSDELNIQGREALRNASAAGNLCIYNPGNVGNEFSDMENKLNIKFYTKIGKVITEKSLAKLSDDYPNGAIMKLQGADKDLWEKQEKKRINVENGGLSRQGEEDSALSNAAKRRMELELGGDTPAAAFDTAKAEFEEQVAQIASVYD